jgi:hypothetical protein
LTTDVIDNTIRPVVLTADLIGAMIRELADHRRKKPPAFLARLGHLAQRWLDLLRS